MQYSKNKGHQTALSIILSTLLIIAAFFPAAGSAQTDTFVLGNRMENWQYSGPSRDGTSKFSYPSGRTVYFSRTNELAPANVTINWNSSHGSASLDAGLFCYVSEQGQSTTGALSIESGFVSAGSYGGVDIFKTNIPGLYFSLKLRSFGSYVLNVHGPETAIQNGIIHNVISVNAGDGKGCEGPDTAGPGNYYTWGGLSFYAAITFYTDQTYTPGTSKITLLKNGDYHVRIWNENPGEATNSYYQNVTFDISSVTVAEPTCSTQPVVSGSSVSGSTVDLGHYSPNDIIKGAAAVPFAINLAGCKGLRNIDVTLSSTTVASDPTMLGNILSSNKATGIGLEIAGAANKASTQTVMIPNDTSSVYHDQRDTSGDDNIYGSSENGKVQTHTLNFLATLKRDGNQSIGSGNFKATGTFTINYP
ncbi:TPA: fimbrial protein [Salmonella enterica subsp. salamae serovar [1],40:z35:e,n,x,z15]|nr:fimbrial protein [Salmonella enterica]HCM1999206.1 fimbrial protein [Salmonella enterica subsp. salamae serovar [1],40:z35:e,n,x,z15]